MRIIDNIPIWGETIDEGALKQIQNCARQATHVAMMADHHKGYAVPIGGVVAYENAISPSGVGYDIGCGNKAVRLDVPAYLVRSSISTIMDEVVKRISFGVGRNNDTTKVEHELFDSDLWEIHACLKPLKQLARNQLGTVGSGNHYVDIFVDEFDGVWVGVHFGSRGLGHKIATWFLKAGGGKDGMDVDPLVLPLDSSLGSEYLECMSLAGTYAYAGRNWVCQEVANILEANIVEQVHNHHNFAWQEYHNGRWLWVVRKGATPAFPGQRGFVGGSMGEQSVILEGVEHPDGAASLYSTVHGAGRAMGRREAAGKKGQPGRVTPEMMRGWLDRSGVELRGGGLDESPDCYKRLPAVLAAQGGSIRILHTLTPLGVAMAGRDTFDPYKD